MKHLRRISLLMCSLAILGLLAGVTPAKAYAADELTGLNAMEVTHMMGKGWNLGNSLDATGGTRSNIMSHETSWGNPEIVPELIKGVKEAGFDTIRIPCTWARYIDKNDGYKIVPEYMARVHEVVDMAYNEGLFVILNVHHESWVNSSNLENNPELLGEELSAVWAQIADEFADYDQHLIFEGMNEPRCEGTSYEWTGNPTCYKNLNYLNQLFVDTIRANGKGHNSERILGVPTYAAQCSTTAMRAVEMPVTNGVIDPNVMLSVHCYNPYDFCLSDKLTEFSPKKSADTGSITQMFTDLQSLFLSKGIAAYVGECGATNSNNNLEARENWFEFFGQAAAEKNVPAIVWDNGAGGTSGGECHKYLDRKTGKVTFPTLISAFIYGSTDEDAGVLKGTFIDFEPYKKGEDTYLAENSELGLSPSKLGKAKINHTKDATNGNSLEVDPSYIKKDTANLNIKKYNNQFLKITAYICSKSEEDITVAVEGIDDAKITGTVGTEWSRFTLFVKIPNKLDTDWNLYFTGTGKDIFYVDDISIEMIDEASMGESEVLPESMITESASDRNTEVGSSEASAQLQSTNETGLSGKSVTLIIILVVTVTASLMVVVVSQVIKRKKKK